jgi:glucose-1-phosphate adenylyltransferase
VKEVLAIILAGGKGERMGILCWNRPKPLLPFAGKCRVIDFSLNNCIHSGIGKITVLVDYHRWCITNYLDKLALWLPSSCDGFHILEPKSGSYVGTADAVYQHIEYLERSSADKVLMLAGDHVYKMDYGEMLAFHEQMGAAVTIGVVWVDIKQAHRFGIVKTNAKGEVVNFVEKPRRPESQLASMGIYVFDKDILLESLMEDATNFSSIHDFGHSIMPQMVKRGRFFAYEFNGYWRDIGYIQAYYEANMEFNRQQSFLNINDERSILTEHNALPSPQIVGTGNLEHSLISPGCVIKGEVVNSILSPGVKVEEHAMVRDSVIMENTTIGEHSIVDHSILDENTSVGKFCHIGFVDSPIEGQENITVLGRNVTVPPHTIVGRNCRIPTHVEPRDPATVDAIPSGAVISRSGRVASE